MVSCREIDPNPKKVMDITKMKVPESLHDIQKLTRCMAARSSSRGKTCSSGLRRHKRHLNI
jgi:hypothetical protein